MMLFLDMLVMLSLTVWAMRLAMNGLITVQTAALALVAMTAFIAIARRNKMGPIKLAFRIGIPIVSTYAFIVGYTNGDPRATLAAAGAIATLVIALAGVYIMVRGPRKRRS